jgi:DNA polymerase-3 subunit alpha
MNLFALIEKTADPFAKPPSVVQPLSPIQLLSREKELLGFYLTGHPMDSYRKLLSRLSCVPFKDFELLPDSALLRAAFIVENITLKVSSKSQKKFAILAIGDGLERFELPIWPELFEEKAALLKEGQLLYGILQIEKKEGGPQLSAKALEDLTTLDEAKSKALDDLYDRLKLQAKTSDSKWRKEKKEKKEDPTAQEEQRHLVLKLDADRLRHSSILALKDLFREHPGKSTLELHFLSGNRRLGTISIDSQWGVKTQPTFLEKLRSFNFLLSIDN